MSAPAGFKPIFRTSPFLELLGPFYYRSEDERIVIGVRVEEKHTNARGTAHGGLFMTLSDIALGYCTAFSTDPPTKLVTTNLSADFAGAAKAGDWVEAHVDIQKLGGRLAFANAYLYVGSERVVRASAGFLVLGNADDK